MPLKYNDGDRSVLVPNLLRRKYHYSSWQGNVVLKTSNKTITINPKKRIDDAWKHIEKNCAKNEKCNQYFSSLHKGQTLGAILKDVTFTVHQLIPNTDADESKMPFANSAGRDFALHIYAFLDVDADTVKENSNEALAATILHELAHYAGATTDPDSVKALDAENALTHCGLKRFHNPEAKG